MTVSKEYFDDIVDKLSTVAPVRASRLFGEVGLYCNNHLFAIIVNDTLYFKTDAGNRPDFEALGAAAFQPCKEGDIPSHFYQLPDVVLRDSPMLKQWVVRATTRDGEVATMEMAG